MTYKPEIYEAATAALAERRRQAENAARDVENRFFALCPEARELKRGIQSTGSRAARTVLQGGDVRRELERLRNANLGFQQSYRELLDKHGFSARDMEPRYTCPACGDKGYIDGLMCPCLKELLKKTAFDELNRKAPLALSSFASFDTACYTAYPPEKRAIMERIVEYCRNYAKGFTPASSSLLFQGRTGLGKTHLSLAIAGEVMAKGYGVLYSSVHSVVLSVEQQRFQNPEETSDLLCSCDLLILDDLGTEFTTSYTQAVLYNIIDTRIMKHLPTIISTNLSGEELQKRYSERLASRIFGIYQRLGFVGEDYRSYKKK